MLNIFLQKCAYSIIYARGGKPVIYLVSNCTIVPVVSGFRQHSLPIINFFVYELRYLLL